MIFVTEVQMKVEINVILCLAHLWRGLLWLNRNRIVDLVSENNICLIPSWTGFQYVAYIDVITIAIINEDFLSYS